LKVGRLLRDLLYGVSPLDPIAFSETALLDDLNAALRTR
jgi:hypothetical protein